MADNRQYCQACGQHIRQKRQRPEAPPVGARIRQVRGQNVQFGVNGDSFPYIAGTYESYAVGTVIERTQVASGRKEGQWRLVVQWDVTWRGWGRGQTLRKVYGKQSVIFWGPKFLQLFPGDEHFLVSADVRRKLLEEHE